MITALGVRKKSDGGWCGIDKKSKLSAHIRLKRGMWRSDVHARGIYEDNGDENPAKRTPPYNTSW